MNRTENKMEVITKVSREGKTPSKNLIFAHFQIPHFDFSLIANFYFFSVMHASSFLFEKQNRVVASLGFSRLEFLWELVIREGRFWNFYGGVVTVDTRSVFFKNGKNGKF